MQDRDIVFILFLIKNFSDKLPLYEKGGIMQIALPNTQTFEKKEPSIQTKNFIYCIN